MPILRMLPRRSMLHLGFFCLLLAALWALPSPTGARPSAAPANITSPVFAPAGAIAGNSSTVTISDGVAYAGVDGQMAIIDVADPWRPVILGSYTLRTEVAARPTATSIQVVGGRAYVSSSFRPTMCCMAGFLEIVDVQQPDQPQSLGYLPFGAGINDMAVAGNRAYLTSYTFFTAMPTLTVVDVADPSAPSILQNSSLQTSGSAVALNGTVAYIANGEAGVRVMDISGPGQPTLLTTLDTPGSASDIQVVGDRAYLADGAAGLQVLDVSTPGNPSIIGTLDTPGTAGRLRVVGQMAYVADGEAGVQLIDVSDPAQPQLYAGYDTPGVASDIDVAGNTLYIADREGGFRIVLLLDASGRIFLPLAAR